MSNASMKAAAPMKLKIKKATPPKKLKIKKAAAPKNEEQEKTFDDEKKEEDEEEEDTSKYVVRLERAVYGGENGDIIGMETADELEFDTIEEARTEFNDSIIEDVGELLYLDEIDEENDIWENIESRGQLGQDYNI